MESIVFSSSIDQLLFYK